LWYCGIVMLRWCNESAGYAWGAGMAIGESAFFPIDVRIDPFEPGHSEDHLVGTERSNEEGFLVFDTSESEFELDHAIGMN
jgi:hypothetical protein